MMGAARRGRCGVLALALLLTAGCGGEKDPVQALLARLEEAAEARDVEAFAGGLSADFRGGTLSRAATLAELRRYFAMYETVALEVYGVEVERAEGTAAVRCVVEFSGQGTKLGGLDKLLPPRPRTGSGSRWATRAGRGG